MAITAFGTPAIHAKRPVLCALTIRCQGRIARQQAACTIARPIMAWRRALNPSLCGRRGKGIATRLWGVDRRVSRSAETRVGILAVRLRVWCHASPALHGPRFPRLGAHRCTRNLEARHACTTLGSRRIAHSGLGLLAAITARRRRLHSASVRLRGLVLRLGLLRRRISRTRSLFLRLRE